MFQLLKPYKTIFVISLAWIFLWTVPWGEIPSFQGNIFLIFLTDMFRLGFAIAMFIFPGALLYILLTQDDGLEPDFRGFIPIGFTFSVLIIGATGLVGRILGTSFTAVKFSFAFIGLIELFLLAFFNPHFAIDKKTFQKMLSGILKNHPLMLALILATLMTFHDRLIFIDDTTYLAYLTHWQNATKLGFTSIVHEINNIEYERFWLALYPMGQALLADLSGLPGLLLFGNYLEPFLVPLALITAYWFARTLNLSRKAAGFSVLIQITLYAWMLGYQDYPVGQWFYQSMAEDKLTAAFILTPVFFFFGLNAMQNNGKQRWITFLLAGIGLTLTHPVVLFYASFIVICMGIIFLIVKKTSWMKVFPLLLVVAFIMSPYLGVRAYTYFFPLQKTQVPYDAISAGQSFEIEKYALIVNRKFYGLNPEVLKFTDIEFFSDHVWYQAFRLIPVIVALLAGFIAIKKIKQGPLYWYVLSCMFLIVLATVPYTGWILGYFVSARLLPRSSWFSPLGIGGVLVLIAIADFLKKREMLANKERFRRARGFSGTLVGILVCFVFISPMLLTQFVPHIPAYFEALNHNRQLAKVGAYIDHNTTEPVMIIALDYSDLQLLPGVSANTRLISFRDYKERNGHNNFFSINEVVERKYASNAIRSLEPTASEAQRCLAIKKYDLKFVLAESDNAELFADLILDCKLMVEFVFETDDLVLLRLQEFESDY